MVAVNCHAVDVRLSLYNWSYIFSERKTKQIETVIAEMHNDRASDLFG